MKIGSTVMGILEGLILVGSVGVVSLQQQASAFGFVERQQIGDFQKLTGEFVKAVIGAQNPPDGDKTSQFRQLTGQFQSDVINAVLQSPPDPD